MMLEAGAEAKVHDPHVQKYLDVEISQELSGVVEDGKNVLNPDGFIDAGFVYKGVGRGDKNRHQIK